MHFSFSHHLKNESYQSDLRVILTTSPIWSDVGGFVEWLISLFPISCMCLIWLNVDLFSWRLVLIIFLSLRSVMMWTLLNLPVSCWLDMSPETCWNVVGYFFPMLRIQTLFLFLSDKALLHGIFFFDWEIYDMLLWSY